MAVPSSIPCIGEPNFVLFDNSKIIIQGDDVLPPRIVGYLNDTFAGSLKAKLSVEKRLVEIDCEDATKILKSLYSKPTLFRYTHKYFVVQETIPEFTWAAVESLASRLGISLPSTTLRLAIFPRASTQAVLDQVLVHFDKLSPTTYTHILSILRYTDPSTKSHCYKIGFAPAASGLDHAAAFAAIEDENHISRAYYKIQEACERCGVSEWPKDWCALDIGASPGGWSLYLSEVVRKVYAVDPADLVVVRDNIVHLKGQLNDILPQLKGIQLHVVVCDMNVDPPEAVLAFKAIDQQIEVGGRIIWTLKYPKRAPENIERRFKNDIDLFKQTMPSCDVIRTMHMVSNHHERTLVAIKARPSETSCASN